MKIHVLPWWKPPTNVIYRNRRGSPTNMRWKWGSLHVSKLKLKKVFLLLDSWFSISSCCRFLSLSHLWPEGQYKQCCLECSWGSSKRPREWIYEVAFEHMCGHNIDCWTENTSVESLHFAIDLLLLQNPKGKRGLRDSSSSTCCFGGIRQKLNSFPMPRLINWLLCCIFLAI